MAEAAGVSSDLVSISSISAGSVQVDSIVYITDSFPNASAAVFEAVLSTSVGTVFTYSSFSSYGAISVSSVITGSAVRVIANLAGLSDRECVPATETSFYWAGSASDGSLLTLNDELNKAGTLRLNFPKSTLTTHLAYTVTLAAHITASPEALIALVTPSELQTGQDSHVFLDASASYDPDNEAADMSFTWRCVRADATGHCRDRDGMLLPSTWTASTISLSLEGSAEGLAYTFTLQPAAVAIDAQFVDDQLAVSETAAANGDVDTSVLIVDALAMALNKNAKERRRRRRRGLLQSADAAAEQAPIEAEQAADRTRQRQSMMVVVEGARDNLQATDSSLERLTMSTQKVVDDPEEVDPTLQRTGFSMMEGVVSEAASPDSDAGITAGTTAAVGGALSSLVLAGVLNPSGEAGAPNPAAQGLSTLGAMGNVLTAGMVDGEEAATVDAPVLSMAVRQESLSDPNSKVFGSPLVTPSGSGVSFPRSIGGVAGGGSTAIQLLTSTVDPHINVSSNATNALRRLLIEQEELLESEAPNSVSSAVTSISLIDASGHEIEIRDLEEGISFTLPLEDPNSANGSAAPPQCMFWDTSIGRYDGAGCAALPNPRPRGVELIWRTLNASEAEQVYSPSVVLNGQLKNALSIAVDVSSTQPTKFSKRKARLNALDDSRGDSGPESTILPSEQDPAVPQSGTGSISQVPTATDLNDVTLEVFDVRHPPVYYPPVYQSTVSLEAVSEATASRKPVTEAAGYSSSLRALREELQERPTLDEQRSAGPRSMATGGGGIHRSRIYSGTEDSGNSLRRSQSTAVPSSASVVKQSKRPRAATMIEGPVEAVLRTLPPLKQSEPQQDPQTDMLLQAGFGGASLVGEWGRTLVSGNKGALSLSPDSLSSQLALKRDSSIVYRENTQKQRLALSSGGAAKSEARRRTMRRALVGFNFTALILSLPIEVLRRQAAAAVHAKCGLYKTRRGLAGTGEAPGARPEDDPVHDAARHLSVHHLLSLERMLGTAAVHAFLRLNSCLLEE
eukprot:gene3745-4684_t